MSTLNKLGFQDDIKLLMIHADDAGLSHSENKATMQALQFGSVNSYSIMVPCNGFDEMADFALANPQFDYGIHLTLTCEWKDYKFGPVAPLEKVSSLVDENGAFYKKRQSVDAHALPKEVERELTAQIENALSYGLKPSHLDCHMYSLGVNTQLFSVYKNLGEKYNLPILLSKDLLRIIGSEEKVILDESDLEINNVDVASFSDYENGDLKYYYENVLHNLSPGLNMILIHPAFDTVEMQSITIDHPNFGSEWRQMDFDFFTSNECSEKLKENNIELIDWSQITARL